MQVDFSLDDLDVPEFEALVSDGFHINSLMLPQMEHELHDGVEKFATEFELCQNLEDDYITEFLDGILCDQEDCSPDVSNACSGLTPYYSYRPSEAFSIRDSTTCISGDYKDMTADVRSSLFNILVMLLHDNKSCKRF